MHTVFALLCFVVVIHWLIFPYPSGLLHWHCGNLTIAPVPAKQPWWIWINTSYEFIMNDYITTTKQSTTKPCAYFLGYTVVTCLSFNLSKSVSIVVLLRYLHMVGCTLHVSLITWYCFKSMTVSIWTNVNDVNGYVWNCKCTCISTVGMRNGYVSDAFVTRYAHYNGWKCCLRLRAT